MTGKVYLVGAGPGDRDLLTLKALRLLKTADVVLHDDLVSTEILNLVSPRAQLQNVGKRCGAKNVSQDEINFLMTSLAGSGLAVVRLKSGDPLIFGRGGEEIEALRKANIEYEIVPGITAVLGAAAAAQIPLTHRHISHGLVFLPGQFAEDCATEWKALVSRNATLVIYMPGRNFAELASRLVNAGLRGETPCALVSAATTSDQLIGTCTLYELGRIRRVPTPALLIVGEVVSLSEVSAMWNRNSGFPNSQSPREVSGEGRHFAREEEFA